MKYYSNFFFVFKFQIYLIGNTIQKNGNRRTQIKTNFTEHTPGNEIIEKKKTLTNIYILESFHQNIINLHISLKDLDKDCNVLQTVFYH